MNTLPLIIAKDIEAQRTFEGISTPVDLAIFLARILAVDFRSVEQLQEIYIGSVEPGGPDRKPIWINTSTLYSIALLVGNSYRHIYPYPVNTPFIWTQSGELPQFARRLSVGELAEFSLTAPTNEAYYYVIIPR
jgi:hypothetical protein